MSPRSHLTISLGLAIAYYYATQNLNYSLLVLLVGVFVDLDHLFEFWVNEPKKWYRVREFMSGKHFRDSGKIYLWFHSWEYLLIWTAVWLWFGWYEFGLAISIPYFTHLIMDQIGNNTCGPFYFLVYRIKTGFKIQKLCTDYDI